MALLAALCTPALRADDRIYQNGFDDPQHTWVAEQRSGGPTIQQFRTNREPHSGAQAEQFNFLTQQPQPLVQLAHELPPSLQHGELTGSLWVRASRGGIRLALQVRFPNEIDPRTNRPLQAVLTGDPKTTVYTAVNEWQRLTCVATDDAVQEVVRRLRGQLRQQSDFVPIDQRTVIVERMVVQLELPAGQTALQLDDLAFGPIVPPAAAPADPMQRRQPREGQFRATIGDDQLLIDGRPSIVLFTPYHSEEVDELARMRFNVAWIDRYDDAALLAALSADGLFAMANPLPYDIPLEEAVQPNIGLASFDEETSPVMFWYMGTRLPAASLQTQTLLMNKVRAADRQLRRPIFVDVTGEERQYHRAADMVGLSRHTLHTSTPFFDYYTFLRNEKKGALPDKPVFTLIQTEPAVANLESRSDGQTVPVVEPEQIWMEGYAALAAGYKGIGFWKLSSLTESGVGTEERRKAISLFNAHVQLLEPWLASAKLEQLVPATITSAEQSRETGRGRFGWGDQRNGRPQPGTPQRSPVQVAVFNCDQGRLLMPLWFDDNGQFQQGPMTADEISFVVVAPENIQAWEVTTTSVTPLPNKVERLSGGWQIRLSGFDQFATIVLTQGEAPVRELKQRSQALQADCVAREWIDLASAKTSRVSEVHGKLSAVAPSIAHADSMLSHAMRFVDVAEQDLARGDVDGARQNSRKALLLTRIVQRQHWANAVNSGRLTSGVSSPHTICFQTLPDHWRLLGEIGKGSERDENLLRSGGFEDSETFRAHGWKHWDGDDPRVRPYAELYGVGAAEGTYCLRLLAQAVDQSHAVEDVRSPPKTLVSPPLSVYAGQIVHISGKVQISTPITGHPDGLVIYESTKGTVGALRWREPTPAKEWVPFQLIREIHSSQDLTVTIELRGLGEVHIDDLKVVPIDPDS